MKTVTVVFVDSMYNKSYDYLVPNKTKVAAGDYAVAHNMEYKIVKVIDVNKGKSTKANKGLVKVITKQDFLDYQNFNKQL